MFKDGWFNEKNTLKIDKIIFKIEKVMLRAILISIIAIPVQAVFYLFGLAMMHNIYLSFHEYFAFDWTAYGDVRVDIRRFFEFWHTGLGIYIVNVAIHTILQLIFRRKLRFDIAGSLIITFVFSAIMFDMRRPAPGFILSDWGYSIAYTFLFAMIMFATFTLSTLSLDKLTKWKEYIKVPLSFVLSCLIGGILSYSVWVVMFGLFHGW